MQRYEKTSCKTPYDSPGTKIFQTSIPPSPHKKTPLKKPYRFTQNVNTFFQFPPNFQCRYQGKNTMQQDAILPVTS